ncbi:MAG TPA: alpha/beta hydrolase fold domain-containing protein [Thermoguttaceae bacterium]|nr:alpha/beta hydrolase fold domain-containing protein [Thermoguttaceae bacterium]
MAPRVTLAHTLTGHGGYVSAVAFSPDDSLLVTGSWDGTARLWDVASGKEVRTLAHHKMAVISVAFSPDGRLLAVGSDDTTVTLWEVATGRLVRTLDEHSSYVLSVTFSPDGRLLASSTAHGKIKLWDVSSGQEVRSLEGQTMAVYCLAFSPDGRQLASGSRDATIVFWEVAGGKRLRTLKIGPGQYYVYSIAFSPDGCRLASGSTGGGMRMFDVATGEPVWIDSIGNTQPYVWPLAFGAEGRWIVSGNGAGRVQFWDAESGQKLSELTGHTEAIEAVALSRDGRWLASASDDNTARLWRLEDSPPFRSQVKLPAQAEDKRAPRSYERKPDLENVAYGEHARNVLDFWKAKSDRPTPLVVFFHPGGFGLGDKTWIPLTLLEDCLNNGISVATANYRYSFQARWPAQVEDSARAIQFLRLHAKGWNLNPKAFAATGSSAGAGISVWLAFHDDMADPSSTDPVKRQSTRLCVVGFSNGQTTYDPREIAEIIGEENARKMGRMALTSLFGLRKDEDVMEAKRVFPLFEDSSGLKHVKPGDPPVFMYYSYPERPLTSATPQDEAMHNIRFGFALKERMDRLGIECVVRNVSEYPANQGFLHQRDMVEFFRKHFPREAE